jgi:hypothetical protein
MKDSEYNRLIALMKDSTEAAVMECLGLIQESKPEYAVGEAVPATEVWDIYSKRQAWNENTSNPKRNRITGYDPLMKRLPRAPNQNVRKHTLKWQNVTVMLFTDEPIASFFGSLRITETER